MSRILTLLFIIGFCIPVLAQPVERCGFDHRMDRAVREKPDFLQLLHEQELLIQSMYNNHSRSLDSDTITIPVVVHVMHTGQSVGTAVNLSDAQIKTALDQLNKAFAGTGGYATPVTGIRFALARRTPGCEPTDGIIRVNTQGVCVNNECYEDKGITAGNERAVKSLSRWPANQYLNIWVVREIGDNGAKSGIQGYAQFPGGDPEMDGVVILYNAFGYQDNADGPFNLKNNTRLGTILIHEIGHILGLYHSFEGDDFNRDGLGDRCPSFTGCGPFNGDCVADTPPHRRSGNNCLVAGTNVCDGGYSNELFVHNFMDYSSQECQYEFTQGQVDRMLATLHGLRPGWIHSPGAIPVDRSAPVASGCIPQTKYPDNNFGLGILEFQLGDFSVISGNAKEDGGYVDNWCSVISVEPGKTYDLSLNTGTQNIQNVRVFIDYNGDGDFSDQGEAILTSDKSTSHQVKVTIPASAKKGIPLRVRGIAAYSGFKIPDACFEPYYGQVEDYTMMIGTPLLVDKQSGETGDPATTASFSIEGDPAYTIYPNPVDEVMHLANHQSRKVFKLELLDLQGRLISRFNPGQEQPEILAMNIKDLQSGMYYLRISDDQEVTVKRLQRL